MPRTQLEGIAFSTAQGDAGNGGFYDKIDHHLPIMHRFAVTQARICMGANYTKPLIC